MGRIYKYTGVLEPLNQELDDISRRLEPIEGRKTTRLYAEVGTTETEIRHNLGRVPESVVPVPRGDARVWLTRDPNETSVYLQASVAVRITLELL